MHVGYQFLFSGGSRHQADYERQHTLEVPFAKKRLQTLKEFSAGPQSFNCDVWNWSLVAVADGPLPVRGGVRVELKSPPLSSRMDMVPLQFPERGLERIVEAAARATLPEDGPRFKLEHLRVLAGQLIQTRPEP